MSIRKSKMTMDNPVTHGVAGWVLVAHAAVWAILLGRWVTFGAFGWEVIEAEHFLVLLPGVVAYVLYGGMFGVDLVLGVGLLTTKVQRFFAVFYRRGAEIAEVSTTEAQRERRFFKNFGMVRAVVVGVLGCVYFWVSRDFYGACLLVAVAGFLIVLLRGDVAWGLNYPAAFWIFIFFIVPMLIVFVVSLGERTRLGTVSYPLTWDLRVYFNDYGRFFQRINGDLIYLRIFMRSMGMALGNTLICLLIGYPFAYWIARRPAKYRPLLIFLVMIPFWTNFLVRTFAWMLILRDSGLINTFWTGAVHTFFTGVGFDGLARMTENELPLLFNQGAVFLGLFYGYLPFVVLPIYSNLEKLDWTLLEAASDLGAGTWHKVTRILLPLTMPGTVAAAIIVFIPSLGAYVTPDLLGGGKVALLGNLLQQQFMTVRDWPFGSAIGFIMMTMMLVAILIYFRVGGREQG